jgi:hypothetical protein
MIIVLCFLGQSKEEARGRGCQKSGGNGTTTEKKVEKTRKG